MLEGLVDLLASVFEIFNTGSSIDKNEEKILSAQVLKIDIGKKIDENVYIVSRKGEKGVMNLKAGLVILGINPRITKCESNSIEFENGWRVEGRTIVNLGSDSQRWHARSYATADIWLHTKTYPIVVERVYKSGLMKSLANEYLIYLPTNKGPKQFYEEIVNTPKTKVKFGDGFIGVDNRWYSYSFTIIPLFVAGIKIITSEHKNLVFNLTKLDTRTPRNILFFEHP